MPLVIFIVVNRLLINKTKTKQTNLVNEGAIPLVCYEPELGTYYHYTPTSHTRDTVRGVEYLLPFLRAEHTCCLTAAILDFAKGAFFEVNRGKNHTLYLGTSGGVMVSNAD